MDIFQLMEQKNNEKESPLAARLRPKTIDEVVGQEHILAKDKLLYRAIKADKLSSVIFTVLPARVRLPWPRLSPIPPNPSFAR